MVRTKQKRIAKEAAATQAPASENSAVKPVKGSANAPAQSSEGPTLPSLYAARINPEGGIMLDTEDTNGARSETRAKKRRKSKMMGGITLESEDEEQDHSFADHMPTDISLNLINRHALSAQAAQDEKNMPAYVRELKPWELLPANVKNDFEKRMGGENFWDSAIRIPVHKNSNISATVNRVKSYLLKTQDEATLPTDLPARSAALNTFASTLLPLSAQGPGIQRLVTVYEIAKRVCAPGKNEKETGEVEKWYGYSVLASRTVEERKRKFAEVREWLSDFEEGMGKMSRKKREGKFKRAFKRMMEANGKNGETVAENGADKPEGEEKNVDMAEDAAQDNESEAAFEPMETESQGQNEKATKTKAVPVLTIWISRKPIPEFREAFGEDVFSVFNAEEPKLDANTLEVGDRAKATPKKGGKKGNKGKKEEKKADGEKSIPAVDGAGGDAEMEDLI
ncbi:hypothetical protein GQ43DRAFT_439701 [Delitschia confertaspora ATCC 74209]|uniref:Uncharacterized protein n=1 Tax=Delitschia confertaspora ATCC 74209 TaxID=1513339 RepID=A0A9P4JQE2_9PLEO|nr:hypothetical protein GQ43DRAFT_439701 [Delitschia confertaspora ATCC 74209]